MTLPSGLIISVSGIRGRVGLELTPDVVARFAASFGSYVKQRGWAAHVAVARDSRPSGPVFADVAAAGLRAVGCRVSDLGLVPTPTALLEIEHRGLGGGVIVTASHNPREWNALKLAGPTGAFLTPDEGSALLAQVDEGRSPEYAGWSEFGDIERVAGAAERHRDRIRALELIDVDRLRAEGLHVALDCTRGAGGVIMPDLLDDLGCHVTGIDLEPDGLFTREPEPVPENLAGLSSLVRESGADLGMALDPDADRLALVDEEGRAVGEDFTLALVARLVLQHRPGPVVTNLSTSRVLDDVCERAGVPLHRAPVGEANVAAAMREVDAVIGGEGNGGVILPSLHLTRDAPLAAALVLELLAETDRSLRDLVAEYPKYRIVKERVERPQVELDRIYDEIERALSGGEVDRRDGLHLRWASRRSWLHVRPSGTEPILRIIAEGPAEEEARVRRLIDVARETIAAEAS